jgi:hypothetical protein
VSVGHAAHSFACLVPESGSSQPCGLNRSARINPVGRQFAWAIWILYGLTNRIMSCCILRDGHLRDCKGGFLLAILTNGLSDSSCQEYPCRGVFARH